MEFDIITLLGVLILGPVVVYLVSRNSKNSLFILISTFPMFNIETINLGGGFLVISPNKVFGALVVVLMAVDVISKGREFRFLSPHVVLTLLLLAMLLLSFMVNGARNLSWAQRYLSNLVFLLAMVTWIDTREEADRVWQVFVYSLAFLTVLTLFGLLGGQEVGRRTASERFEATMLNANRAARTYITGFGLALGLLLSRADQSRHRWFTFAALLLFGWSILLTGSRAGLIALLILGSAAPFLMAYGPSTRALVVPIILAAGLFAIFAPQVIVERSSMIPGVERGMEEESKRSRIHQYRLGVDLITNNPVLGIGPDEFSRVYAKRLEGTTMVRVLHSWYLKVAVDAGVPALLLFLGLLGLSLVVGLRGALFGPTQERRRQAWAFAVLVIALSVFGTVSSVPYSKLNWLIFAIAAVELHLQQQERENVRQDAVLAFRDRAEALSAATGTVVVIKKD